MAFAKLSESREVNFRFAGARVQRRNLVLMACAQQMFQGEMERLGKVLTFDSRGTGKSFTPKNLDSYSVAAYSSDLHDLIKHVGVKRGALVGYSHGAYFAAEFAITHPELVSALVLIEPALFIDKSWLRERVELVTAGDMDGAIRLLLHQIAPALSLRKKEYTAMLDSIKAHYREPIGLAGEWNARINHELDESQLCEIRTPTLIIGGTKSAVRSKTMRVASLIPHASTWWVPGATHLLIDEKPKQIATVINHFLKEHEA
jgi:pimeloyl-ACP methyl ester carboxylesterase